MQKTGAQSTIHKSKEATSIEIYGILEIGLLNFRNAIKIIFNWNLLDRSLLFGNEFVVIGFWLCNYGRIVFSFLFCSICS